MTSPSDADLIERFSYHPATAETAILHDMVRTVFLDVALGINGALPACRETSLALTRMEEALMWANKAIAVHGAPMATEEQKAAPQPTYGQDTQAGLPVE